MKARRIFLILLAVLLVACTGKNTGDTDLTMEGGTLDEQLILAAEVGDTKQVLQILEDGADIHTTDGQGRTPVLAATYNNQAEAVSVLIQEGADINSQDHRLENVILHSGASGYLEIVQMAIKAGADMTITNRFGGTALIPASERGHVEAVKELLENSDVDVNHINNLHWTALLEAVILGNGGEKHQEIVQLLVDHGADIHIGDENGITSLDHAEAMGFQEIVDILKKADK